MANRDKPTSQKRHIDIVISMLLRLARTVVRLIFVLAILALVTIILGSVMSLLVTTVVLIDNPTLSFVESFGEYYIKHLMLLIKIFGCVMVVLFLIVPIDAFFDD